VGARPMRAGAVGRLMVRDLDRLHSEIEAYPSEGSIWATGGEIANSGGTLALHLAGNLRHFVGAILGGDGYVRDRDYEFSASGVPRAEVLDKITTARAVVDRVVQALDQEKLDSAWVGPSPLGEGATNYEMLLHLSGHLMYHTGQVNYHRRILGASPGA